MLESLLAVSTPPNINHILQCEMTHSEWVLSLTKNDKCSRVN